MIAFVGNKLDLESERAISTDDAKAYAAQEGLLFAEASAKTGENVMDLFFEIGN